MLTVQYFGNFKADNRVSMDGYLQQLMAMMAKYSSEKAKINTRAYIPSSAFANNPENNIALRLARYISYPYQIKSLNQKNKIEKNTLFHICDHGYAHLLKSLPAERVIVTVHDLIPLLKYRKAINDNQKNKRPLLSEYSLSHLKKAAHIIAISENTKQDLLRYNLAKSENISVIYSGILSDDIECLSNQQQAFNSIQPYIDTQLSSWHQWNSHSHGHNDNDDKSNSLKTLLVCGSSFYKNLPLSVEIFNRLQSKHGNIQLIHWGAHSLEWQQAKSKIKSLNTLIEIPYLPDNSKVKALYRSVDCVLFPSLYEGFGLPPAEAMALGTPVIMSNKASLPEVAGADEYCCDIDNIDAFVAKTERLLFDPSYRDKAIKHGLSYSQKFNWQSSIKQLTEIYESVQNNIS